MTVDPPLPRQAQAIEHARLGWEARVDERTRRALMHALNTVVRAIEAEVRRHASRRLADRGAVSTAEKLLASEVDVPARLTRARLLPDPALRRELLARVREQAIAAALPTAAAVADQPSLLVRLLEAPDNAVASAARALMAAKARRRGAGDGRGFGQDLPGELHHRLTWWVAAAVREAFVTRHGEDADTDRAIADGALRSVAMHDEGEAIDAIAARLALAIDARSKELAPLLVEALGDRELTLFTAVLAHAVGLDYPEMRGVVLEPRGERLSLALRAAGLERASIARIGLAFADADSLRDVERLADTLDEVASTPADAARDALAPLALHRDFRAALDVLAWTGRR